VGEGFRSCNTIKALEKGVRILKLKGLLEKEKNKFSANGTHCPSGEQSTASVPVGCPEKENADIGMFVAYFFVITW
jgi:hypothetical protein